MRDGADHRADETQVAAVDAAAYRQHVADGGVQRRVGIVEVDAGGRVDGQHDARMRTEAAVRAQAQQLVMQAQAMQQVENALALRQQRRCRSGVGSGRRSFVHAAPKERVPKSKADVPARP